MLFFPLVPLLTSLDIFLLSVDTVRMWWITEFHVTSKIWNLSLLPVFSTFNLKKMALVTQANYLLTTWPWTSLPQFPCWKNGNYNICLTSAHRDVSRIKCDNEWKCSSSTLDDVRVYLRYWCIHCDGEYEVDILVLRDNNPWGFFHFRGVIPLKVFGLIGRWDFFVSETPGESWFHSCTVPTAVSFHTGWRQVLPNRFQDKWIMWWIISSCWSPVYSLSWKVAYMCIQPCCKLTHEVRLSLYGSC